MKTFKQFILEIMRDYRLTWRGATAKYDPDYYDKKVDKLDYNGKSIAYKHVLVKKPHTNTNLADILKPSDDVIHRGMSHEEYENIKKTGKIASKGGGNLGKEQEGLTYFTTEPSSAESYSNTFAMSKNKPTPERPAYVVSIRRPHPSRIKHVEGTGKHEVGVTGEISADDIVAVHKGHVIQHDPATFDMSKPYGRGSYEKNQYLKNKKAGTRISSMSSLHWEKIK